MNPDFIRGVYLALLDRLPESQTAIDTWLNSGLTENEIIYHIRSSLEHKRVNYKNLLIKNCNKTYIENENFSLKQKFTIIQTSDQTNYSNMLLQSFNYNLKYAQKYGWDYNVFVGLKKGNHPIHAMFNRIFILKDLLRTNYKGWVLYLDADAVITNPNYDFKEVLENLSFNSKAFYFFNHHKVDDPEFNWWYVNTGVFAINLEQAIAAHVVDLWASLYENFFSEDDFIKANKWSELINDQDALHFCLQEMDKKLEIQKYIVQGNLYDCFVNQFGRLVEDPTDSDINARIERISSAGKNAFD